MRIRLPTEMVRLAWNAWPCIRGTGGRVTFLSKDYTRLTVRLPLNWRTRNAVGTIFGGSMYSATDPFFMLMLMEVLGKDYVVWDKGATIRFKRPAKETLFTEFYLSPERVQEVKDVVREQEKATFTWTIELKSKSGTVYAEIDKVIYVAKKSIYQEKRKKAQSATKFQSPSPSQK